MRSLSVWGADMRFLVRSLAQVVSGAFPCTSCDVETTRGFDRLGAPGRMVIGLGGRGGAHCQSGRRICGFWSVSMHG